jgi:hypothetical protein
MKKNIIINIILLLTLTIFFFNKNLLITGTITGSKLFLYHILPTILPMYIITQLMLNYNLPYYIAKVCHNNLYIFILIMSVLAGTPNNAVIIAELLNKRVINLDAANQYLKYSFFSNPLFLLTILSKIFSLKDTLIIIAVHYLANIILYLRHPIHLTKITKSPVKPFNEVLIQAINQGSLLLLNIYITIICFNIIIALIPHNLAIYNGLIELTYGLNNLHNLSLNTLKRIYLATIYISWGGISIHMQIKSVINNTSLNYLSFLKGRIEQILVSLILLTTIIGFTLISQRFW